MIIHTFGGQASIMGKDTSFIYDGKLSELRLQGITFEDAQRVLGVLEGNPGAAAMVPTLGMPVVRTGMTAGHLEDRGSSVPAALVSHAQQASAGAETAPPAASGAGVGRGPLGVDADRMRAIAAGSPAKPEKPEKPAKPKKGAKEVPAETETAEASAEEAKPETPPPPESAKQVTNGKAAANGTAKASKADLPKGIEDARKLRDVLTIILDHDGKKLGDPNTSAREQAVLHLKKRCAEMKDDVPCLSRIADVDSRIDRTVEVMDMGDEIS